MGSVGKLWQEEKARKTVQALCSLLATKLDADQRCIVKDSLHHALKLYCDVVATDIENVEVSQLWSVPLVDEFFNYPESCDQWLERICNSAIARKYQD